MEVDGYYGIKLGFVGYSRRPMACGGNLRSAGFLGEYGVCQRAGREAQEEKEAKCRQSNRP